MVALRDQQKPEEKQIKDFIKSFIAVMKGDCREVVNEEFLFRDILSQINTWQADPSVLRDDKHAQWLFERKNSIEWSFWKRYRQYLEDEKNWPSLVTNKLDNITDSILGDLCNPVQDGQLDRRGMVVGEVQSGKTANYTGLICKAVDAGYKLIIVLAGMTNDLRSQTQSRLDAEFLGFESEVGKVHNNGSRIGVGLINTPTQLIVHPLTYGSHDGDFRANKSANLQLGASPLLLVVKKNVAVLNRIRTWVENQGRIHPETGKKVVDGIPLLLLDDEADNASINTKKDDEDPTQINKAIRLILNAFQQRSYVGYTATPFANIFIPPDEENDEYGEDLFPKGFIYNIKPPSNYIGPAQLFGLKEDLDGDDNTSSGMPLIRHVDDSDFIFPHPHKKELVVDELPTSLIQAMQSFVISCAARCVRGQQNVHNSMLIHVTRFNMVQQQVIDLVNAEINNMRRTIEYGTGPQAVRLFAQLNKIWEEDYCRTFESMRQLRDDHHMIPVGWNLVQDALLNTITKIQIRGINGDAGGTLDYSNNPNGLNVIAVGGDKLSRGLTLEGLSISYYIRPANNYDTLLQMGRWFGYRPGYVDLCRLYTTQDIISWYEHITVANEELKKDFDFMELSHLTPAEYGLKVRTHPSGLNITATNKIRHGKKMKVSFSSHLTQTTIFDKDPKVCENNLSVTEQWILSLSEPSEIDRKRVIWRRIPAKQIINFLEQYRAHPLCRQVDGELLIKYIQKLTEHNELVNWTVAMLSNSMTDAKQAKIGGYNIGLLYRADNTPNDNKLYMLKKSNILSPEDEQIDLSDQQKENALKENIKAWEQGYTRLKKKPEKPSGPFIRKARSPKNGLLLIYPLINPANMEATPIIGFAISFPESYRAPESGIEYQVNTTYWRERYSEEDE